MYNVFDETFWNGSKMIQQKAHFGEKEMFSNWEICALTKCMKLQRRFGVLFMLCLNSKLPQASKETCIQSKTKFKHTFVHNKWDNLLIRKVSFLGFTKGEKFEFTNY